jgi:hypothetical protein
METKVSWEGTITAVQPRIRLMRSFDETAHTYLGYNLKVRGVIDGEEKEFVVGIGKAAQLKHQFHVGVIVSGKSCPVADSRTETADVYKTSGLKVIDTPPAGSSNPPPWHGAPPDLPTYRERRHRRLNARTYSSKCGSCIWGCRMPVEITIDHWNPGKVKYRFETFCYGPKSCRHYSAGATRKVPGRNGMTWEEPDWLEEDATAHRGDDE